LSVIYQSGEILKTNTKVIFLFEISKKEYEEEGDDDVVRSRSR